LRRERFPAIPSFVYNAFWSEHCLQQVSITHCTITSIPDGFQKLRSLKALVLHSNQIASVPASLATIFSLKLLDLHNNKLKTLPSELSRLKNLRELNIAENPFEPEPLPDCLGRLSKRGDINIIGILECWEDPIREFDAGAAEGGNEPTEEDIEKAMQKMKSMGLVY